MILALMKKDFPWLLLPLVVAATTLVLVAVQDHVAGAWVRLDQRIWAVVHCLMWAPTVVAAAVLALRDPIGRTEELLHHRSASHAHVYRAQVVLGLLFVAWLTVVLLLFDFVRLAWDGLWEIALVDMLPFGFVLSGSILSIALFAVTLLSLRLPVSWFLRIGLLVLLVLAVILVHSVSTGGWERGSSPASLSVHLFVMTGLAALLLWMGSRCTMMEHDPDIALGLGGLRPLLWCSVPLLTPLVTLGLSLAQDASKEPLRDLRPVLVETEAHGFTLARWHEREGYTLLDDQRTALATDVSGDLVLWRSGASSVRSNAPEFFDYRLASSRRSIRVWQREARGSWTVVLADTTGELLSYVLTWGDVEAPPPFRQSRPDGAGFSKDAFLMSYTRRGDHVHFVADPADRSVWKLEFDSKRLVAPRLTRTALPGEDRILGHGLAKLSGNEDWTTGLVCEGSGYVWDGSRWIVAARIHRRDRRNPPVDALAPIVSTPRRSGEPRREWTLAPSGLLEWSAAGLFVAPALARPLPSALWAVVSPDRGSRRHWSKDLVLGDYPWLLVLPLLGTALTMLWIRRRLQRLGADPRRLRPWLIVATVLGPATLVLFLPIETRRAHRRLPLELRTKLRIGARGVA